MTKHHAALVAVSCALYGLAMAETIDAAALVALTSAAVVGFAALKA